MIDALQAGKGALVGDLIEFIMRIAAKVSFRWGDAEFWTWAAIVGGSIVAVAIVMWLVRASRNA